MSNTRNQCDGVGNAAKPANSLDRDFAQLTQSYQAHGGEVNTGTTPQVQYSYADGSSNTIRITGMTYPNGRNVVDDYGTTGSINEAASRLGFVCLTSCGTDFSRFQASEQRERVPWYRAVRPTGSRAMPLFGMKDSGASSNLVEYSYLGLSGFVKTVYPVSGTQYTLIGTTGGTNPDSGDIYLGLDRFGRVIDANWANVAGTATLARVKYGYNRVSSRTWRDNLSPGMTGYDELYGYDQLQRLQNLGRGTLNGTQTAITSPTFGQDWTLDETGNWNGFKQSDNGSTWPLDQTRTANTVNEITSLVNETSKAWTTPGYDKGGNMTRIPVPGTPPDGVAWNPMTLSEWDNLKLADWEEMTLDNVEGVYDAWNRLVRLHVGDTTLAEYTYDARGYRIRKDSYTDGTLTETRHYYYTPGWQVVEERVGTSTSANRQFVWGLRYIDDLVLRDRDTDGNGTLNERRYGLQDGNWNTIALTSTSGAVTERFNYDAYGVPTFLTGTGTVQASSPTGWETLYGGYRWDGDPSRMYYVRNRFLLPYVGTWNRRDPIGYIQRSLGLNQYSANAPMQTVDPLGLWNEGGHFYTTYFMAQLAGMSNSDSLELAAYSQLPDEMAKLDAAFLYLNYQNGEKFDSNVGCKFANNDERLQYTRRIHQVLHSLTGQQGQNVLNRREKLRDVIRNAIQEKDFLLAGLAIHSFGDSYAHSSSKNGVYMLYPTGLGHGAQDYSPDIIGDHFTAYSEYFNDLAGVMGVPDAEINSGLVKGTLQDLAGTTNTKGEANVLMNAQDSGFGYSGQYRPERKGKKVPGNEKGEYNPLGIPAQSKLNAALCALENALGPVLDGRELLQGK